MNVVVGISSLKELLETLPSCKGKDYVSIARNMSIPVSDFKDYQFWNKAHYTRNCIVRTDAYELILLCWEKDQVTPVHCHGGEECWVYALQGNLKEYRYVKKGEEVVKDHEMEMAEGRISYMNDEMGYHALENTSGNRAMSLHLYMNPIDRCQVFCNQKNDFEFKQLSYYSLEGKKL